MISVIDHPKRKVQCHCCDCTAQQKTKASGAWRVNATRSLGSNIEEGRKGTPLACAMLGKGREYLHREWRSPPGSMATGQLMSYISSNNEPISKTISVKLSSRGILQLPVYTKFVMETRGGPLRRSKAKVNHISTADLLFVATSCNDSVAKSQYFTAFIKFFLI